MKKALSILICILAYRFALQAQSIYFADPYILNDSGTYYLYGTHAADGIAVLVSRDLKTWESPDKSRSFDRDPFLALDKKDSFGEYGFWAPEVYKIGDKYYMYYSAQEHINVAVGDSPLGPFRQKDKKSIVDEAGIDCSLYVDDDGTPYLFWVRFNGGNVIWMAEMEKDCQTIKPETIKFCIDTSQDWEKDWPSITEGPFIVKHNGVYYLTYSANHYKSQCYGVGYATSESLKNPEWKKYDGNPVLMKPEGLVGTGHHSFFADSDGTPRIVFHSHKDFKEADPRKVHISTYGFRADPAGGPDILCISVNYFTPTLQ